METIEIRQNKKTLIPILASLLVALLGMTYYIYFSGKFDKGSIMKIVYVVLNALLLYAIYTSGKKFYKNEPVLTFNAIAIEIIEKGKAVSFPWRQVIAWKIEKDDDRNTHYLIIETSDAKRKINISWLDKRPSEIEELMLTYKA